MLLLLALHQKSRYGYRRITLELKNRGFVVNHKKVKRIMSSLGIFVIKAKAKYKSYRGDMNGTCKNLLVDKRLMKKSTKQFTIEILKQLLQIKNGVQMLLNSILLLGNYIYHQL